MIDKAAATFERVAAEYDFGRPSWPPEAVAAAGLPRDADVADLGAGTGKLDARPARALRPRDRDRAAGRDACADPPRGGGALRHRRGDPARGREPRRCVLWRVVSLVRLAARASELARVLRPGGALTMLWNRGGDRPWPKGIQELLDRVSHSPGRSATRRSPGATRSRAIPSSRFGTRSSRTRRRVTAEALVARIGSWSNFTTLPPAERDDAPRRAARLPDRADLPDRARHPDMDDSAVVIGSGPNGLAGAFTLRPRGPLRGRVRGRARARRRRPHGRAHAPRLPPRSLLGDPPDGPRLAVLPLGRPRTSTGSSRPRLVAHPLDDGTAVVLERDLARRRARPRHRRLPALVEPIVAAWEAVEPLVLGPFPPPLRALPAAARLARLGASPRSRDARSLAESTFETERARALLRRARRALDAPARAPAERRLRARARRARPRRRLGLPARRRAGDRRRARRAAPRARRRSHRRARSTSSRGADVVLADVVPRGAPPDRRGSRDATTARLAPLPARPGRFKLDWALDGPIPWRAPECARAATVHVGGTLDEIAASERAAWTAARPSGRSCSSPSTRSSTRRARRRASTPPGRTATSRTAGAAT